MKGRHCMFYYTWQLCPRCQKAKLTEITLFQPEPRICQLPSLSCRQGRSQNSCQPVLVLMSWMTISMWRDVIPGVRSRHKGYISWMFSWAAKAAPTFWTLCPARGPRLRVTKIILGSSPAQFHLWDYKVILLFGFCYVTPYFNFALR